MKATILGCGGAAGVPGIAAGWGACDSAEPRNRRRRSSILVEEGECRILVDASPDLRDQLLDAGVRRLDGVIFTHDHADHIHGIDDLREINRVTKDWLPVWGSADALAAIVRRFDYAFAPVEKDAEFIYRPMLRAEAVEGAFLAGDLPVVSFDQDHGFSRSLGLRFGKLAYCTDVVDLSEEAFALLDGVEVWIVGCLVDTPHVTHAHLSKVLEWIERVGPKRAVITHMGTRLDYQTLRRTLPSHVEPAYDGMIITL